MKTSYSLHKNNLTHIILFLQHVLRM